MTQSFNEDVLNSDLCSLLTDNSGRKESEIRLNAKVAKWIASLPNAYAEKRLSQAGRKGRVDITGCIMGYRIELEGKIGTNKPTAAQWMWLKRWEKTGAITGVYHSLEEAQDILLHRLYIKIDELGERFSNDLKTVARMINKLDNERRRK